MGRRAPSGHPRWPRLLLGSVLLWRALSTAALGSCADVVDPRFLAECSSPGLNRSVRLAFESYGSESGELDVGRHAAAETRSTIPG